MNTISTIITAIVVELFVAFGLSILLSFPVKWLWNSTLPELFAFKEIGVWMAWKVSFLASILFKSHKLTSSK